MLTFGVPLNDCDRRLSGLRSTAKLLWSASRPPRLLGLIWLLTIAPVGSAHAVNPPAERAGLRALVVAHFSSTDRATQRLAGRVVELTAATLAGRTRVLSGYRQTLEPAADRIDALLVGGEDCRAFAANAEEFVATLSGYVSAGGHLLAVGGAASAFPELAAYSRLIGRSDQPVKWKPAARPGAVAVAVLDQTHPVTQCITHFLADGARLTATRSVALGRGRVLAVGLEPNSLDSDAAGSSSSGSHPIALSPALRPPALWTSPRGRGRVTVLALELAARSSSLARSADASHVDVGSSDESDATSLLDVIVARAVQFGNHPTSMDAISVELPPRWPVAAAHLGPGDTGLVSGVAPAAGFFRGRQVARFMSFHGADWLVRDEREAEEQPDKVIEALAIPTGATVVDLGAGVGYFSLRLAKHVGPTGKVLAVDIQKEMLDRLKQRARRDGVENIVPILAREEDPQLPSFGVHLVLMVDVYHELSDPGSVMPKVRQALRPGRSSDCPGRLVLVEYRGEDPTVRIKPLHRMTQLQAIAELEALGFRWLETKTFLPHQHILIFEPTAAGEEASHHGAAPQDDS